jgi:hypothetical protein
MWERFANFCGMFWENLSKKKTLSMREQIMQLSGRQSIQGASAKSSEWEQWWDV